MDDVQETLDKTELYQALSDYIDHHQQRKHELQTKLNDLKMKLRSIEYIRQVGRFDSVYRCIICDKIKGNGHSTDCWLNKAINYE